MPLYNRLVERWEYTFYRIGKKKIYLNAKNSKDLDADRILRALETLDRHYDTKFDQYEKDRNELLKLLGKTVKPSSGK